MMGIVINIDESKYFSRVMSQFDVFRKSNQHCDFRIKLGLEEIPAHKGVLAASSDYFNAMLSHDTFENQSGFVEFKEVDAECVKICIDFIYTGKATVLEGKVVPLMHVARLFQLQEICDGIANLLEKNLHLSSFFPTKKLAHMYSCKRLDEKCDQYALKNFEQIVETDKFVEFSEDYISFLMESSDTNACVRTKCDALFKWAKNDEENRRVVFLEIVQRLDLLKVPAKNLGYLLKSEPLVYKNEECVRLFTQSLLGKLEIDAEPIQGNGEKICQMVVFDKISKFLQCFNPDQRIWTPMQRINDDMVKVGFSALALYDCIYVLLENRHVYRIKHSDFNAAWVRMADMTENRGAFPPSAVIDHCIYAIGSHSSPRNTVEKYDPLIDEWTKMRNKNVYCSYAAIAATNDAIYSIGGLDQRYNNLTRVERFSAVIGTWDFVAPMRSGRSNCGAIGVGGNIYVLGGFSGHDLTDAEMYSPTTDSWTTLTSMKSCRQLPAVVALENKIYAVGGRGAKSMETYDLEKKEWEIIATWEEMNLTNRASIVIWQYKE